MRFVLVALSLLLAVLIVSGASLVAQRRHERMVAQAGEALSTVENRVNRSPQTAAEPDCVVIRFVSPEFDTDSSILDRDQRAALVAAATAVLTAPCVIDPTGRSCASLRVIVDIDGHTDERIRWAEGGNLALSVDRAAAVVAVLDDVGLQTGRITGWGSARPAPASDSGPRPAEQRWQADRRVELELRCP